MKSRKSKAQIIYEFLKKKIEVGTYSRDDLLPTDLQISEEFNVSRPTVAKAVKKLVNENYLGRKAGHGTYIKERKLKSSADREMTFVLLIPELATNGIFESVYGQIVSMSNSYDFNLILNVIGDEDIESTTSLEKLVSKYINKKVDGVFFTPTQHLANSKIINHRIIQLFKESGVPIILLDRDVVTPPLKSDCDVIGLNNSEAGYSIGQYLLQKGCKKIGFITTDSIVSSVHMRFIGMREAVIKAGLPWQALEVINFEGGHSSAGQNSVRKKRFTCCYCSH